MRQRATPLALGLAFALCATLPALAGTINFNYGNTFTTKNQSLWSTGNAFNFNAGAGVGIGFTGGVNIDATIASASIGVSGNLGLNAKVGVNGGGIDSNLQNSVQLSAPQSIEAGQQIAVTVQESTPSGVFQTSTPSFNASASLNGSIGVSGSYDIFGVASGSGSIGKSFTQNIVSLNTNPLQLQIGDVPVSSAFLGKSFPAPLGSVIFGPFNLSGKGSGTGVLGGVISAPLATYKGDLANALPLLSGSIGKLNWTLFDAKDQLSVALDQTLFLTANPFVELFAPQTGQVIFIDGNGGTADFDVPTGLSSLTIDPFFGVNATLTNNTAINFNNALNLTGGSIGLSGTDLSAGPIFQKTFTNSLPFSVFNSAFDLGGFNTIDGNPFTVKVDTPPTSTPEPTTLVMLAAGMLLAGLGWRRRAAAR